MEKTNCLNSMTLAQVEELMKKRKFSCIGKRNGIYAYLDRTKHPQIIVEVIPERSEFRVIYANDHSINTIETGWVSPIQDKEYFKRVLKGVATWAKLIESYYEVQEGE